MTDKNNSTERPIKISVIIPALNEEKLIGNVLKQFTEDIRNKFELEVIVSDGGSIDKTLEISRVFADKVIEKTDKLKQNISRGRNIGASNSLGDVLIFFNADTRINDPDAFLSEVLCSLKDIEAGAIACPIRVFPELEKASDKAFHTFYNGYVKILNRFFMGMGRGECHIIKRRNFEEAGGYNEDLAAGEDFDLYKRIHSKAGIIFNEKLLVYESPRRYRKFGYVSVIFDWIKNSVWVTLFKRSSSDKWDPVR
ncbi:hypothetical protein BH10BAC5_BH10BAC5_26590 [soil metagenome]